jgi:tripartite ATP-independent transporter DctM subunit
MALLGAPIFIILSAFAISGFIHEQTPIAAVTVDVYNNFANNPLLYTIPLFTLAGFILSESRTSKRMVDVFRSILGFMPGGVALVALSCCSFFTAFTGASGVTIIALGGLLYPILIYENYPDDFALGLLTTGGSLGLLFAPCLPLIIYAVVSGTSVFQIFTAGVLPGVLIIILMGIYSAYIAIKHGVGRSISSISEIVRAINIAKWELAIPIIILVGLLKSYVTIGEMATILVVYSLIIEVFIYKDITIKNIPSIMMNSVALNGAVLIIMGAAFSLSNYMITAEIPLMVLNIIKNMIQSKFLFLALLNIFLLIVGCLLDIYTAIFVMVPLIIPIAKNYDVNLVHLGIIFLANLEIGYLTPPVGMNLFIASIRFDRSITTLIRASIPYILIFLISLIVITYVPFLSLGLVNYFNVQ